MKTVGDFINVKSEYGSRVKKAERLPITVESIRNFEGVTNRLYTIKGLYSLPKGVCFFLYFILFICLKAKMSFYLFVVILCLLCMKF